MSIASLLTAKSSTERVGIKATALRDEWLSRVGSKAYVLVHPSDSSLRITVSDIMAPLRKSYPMLETRTFLERKVGKRWLYVPCDPWGHYRFGNPPIRVPDGTTTTVTLEDGTQVERKNFKEDPLAAAQSILWEAVLWWAERTKFATQEGGIPTGPFPAGMTTDTFYAAASGNQDDGRVLATDTAYADVLSGAASSISASLNSNLSVGQYYNDPNYGAYQAGCAWNTSTIDDSAAISAAVCSLDGSYDGSATDFTVYLTCEFDWTSGDTNALAADDYRTKAQVAAFTPVASFATADYSSDYNAFTDISLAASINKTGWTIGFFWSSRFEAGDTPSGDESVIFEDAEATGTTRDPKLVVTYTVPAGWMGFNDLQGGLNHDMTGGF